MAHSERTDSTRGKRSTKSKHSPQIKTKLKTKPKKTNKQTNKQQKSYIDCVAEFVCHFDGDIPNTARHKQPELLKKRGKEEEKSKRKWYIGEAAISVAVGVPVKIPDLGSTRIPVP